MTPKLVVSDWNGTLITDKDDKPMLKQIGMDELAYCAKRPWRWGRAWNLAMLKGKLEKLVAQYRDDPWSQAELLRATFDLYSSEVIRGTPMSRIYSSTNRYASNAVTRLDPAFNEFCDVAPASFILTSALELGVVEVTNKSGRMGFTPDNHIRCVRGSRIVSYMAYGARDVAADGILLENYDDKAEVLSDILTKESIRPESAVFMGDDFRDEPCAEIVGRFVVAPLAPDAYRQHMASKYGSKVRTPGRAKGEVYKALTRD